jgi:hypothetical protein
LNFGAYPNEEIITSLLDNNFNKTRIVTEVDANQNQLKSYYYETPTLKISLTPTKLTYESINDFTLVKDVSSNSITKTYQYHPFID